MKKVILLAAVILLCYPLLSNGQDSKKPMPGSDRDSHGCIGSAGYTWSAIKHDCIRTFEQDIRLVELNPKGSYTSAATVILSKDKKKAEVFIPGTKGGLILNYNSKSKTWRKGNIVLAQKNGYSISRRKKVIYVQK